MRKAPLLLQPTRRDLLARSGAVYRRGEIEAAAAGILNATTGVEVTST
ncbi:MAG: hypothetical protein OXH70_10525 [Acidobacteria bacterium]|nr:hypothetical protein [Acidobacteriota bacterium]